MVFQTETLLWIPNIPQWCRMITLFESSESNSRCPLYVFSASSAVTDRHAAVNIQHSTHANVWRVMTWRRRRRDVRDVTWRSDITGRLCVAADMVLLTLHLSEVVNFLAFNKRLKGAVTGVQLVSKLINWMLFCNKIWCADSTKSRTLMTLLSHSERTGKA